MLLSDLGATVIKVETAASIDMFRRDTMRIGADEISEGGWGFQDNNRGKLGLRLNIKIPAGRKIFNELVKKADLVVANMGPAAFRKLGLEYDALKLINDRIITINASGMGNWGPYSQFLTLAPVIHSLCGFSSLIGYEDDDSYAYNGIIADYLGGIGVAISAIAALETRKVTGKGQLIDLSQAESMLTTMGASILDWQANGKKRPKRGSRHFSSSMAPHWVYPCEGEDQWCAICCGSDDEWRRLCGVISPEMGQDQRLRDLRGRIAHEAEIDACISKWTRDKEPLAAAKILQAAGVSAGPARSNVDILTDEHLNARGYWIVTPLPPDKEPKELKITHCPIRIGGLDQGVKKAAPPMGADNEYILKTILGMAQAEIDDCPSETFF
jgi:crotonobetainyl-CoA:carnitine CoA-transferase CaiB-like acyl-CoA transferase